MADVPRASVDRALYLAALADAISWQESILATHDATMADLAAFCCTASARCEDFRATRELLLRYERAKEGLTRRRRPRISTLPGASSTGA
jgi:hypothetical protein